MSARRQIFITNCCALLHCTSIHEDSTTLLDGFDALSLRLRIQARACHLATHAFVRVYVCVCVHDCNLIQ